MNIALDVDGVIANFSQAVIDRAVDMGLGGCFPISHRHVTTWGISDRFGEVWDAVKDDPDFWLNEVQPIVVSVPFRPAAYITHRPMAGCEVLSTWLYKHGFPLAPTIHLPNQGLKSVAMLDLGATALVDDKPENYLDVNETPGLTCYLMDQPYNREFDASLRVHSLYEVAERERSAVPVAV